MERRTSREHVVAQRGPPSVSALLLRVTMAASQDPSGMTLTRLARAIGSPASSVQTALGQLLRLGVIRRRRTTPPRYRVERSAPVARSMLEVATALEDPANTIATLVRANPGIVFATADSEGFVVARDRAGGPSVAMALDAALERVQHHHPDSPRVLCMDVGDFRQQIGSDPLLAARVQASVAIVGDPAQPARQKTPGGQKRITRGSPGRSRGRTGRG